MHVSWLLMSSDLMGMFKLCTYSLSRECSAQSLRCGCPMTGITGDGCFQGIIALLCRARLCLSVWQCGLWSQCFPDGFCTLVTFSMTSIHVMKFGYKCSSHFWAPVGVRGKHQLGLLVFAEVSLLFGGLGEVLSYITPFMDVSCFYKGNLSFKSPVPLAWSLQYYFNVLLQCKI